MKNLTRDHNLAHRRYASMVLLLLLFPISNLYSQENDIKNFQVLGGITSGISQVKYDVINYQLEKFHNISNGINVSYPLGVEGAIIYKNKVIINTSFLLSHHRRDGRKHSHAESEFSFLHPTLLTKIEMFPFSFSYRNNYFFSYF